MGHFLWIGLTPKRLRELLFTELFLYYDNNTLYIRKISGLDIDESTHFDLALDIIKWLANKDIRSRLFDAQISFST